jgi:P4 family phage/plasmid primase-like protien
LTKEDILSTLKTLFRPGDTVEMRVLGKGKKNIISGYFRDFDKLAEAACKFDRLEKFNLYVVMNKVDPATYARSPETMAAARDQPTTTGDDNITDRRWLLIDLDAKRASDVSSTAEEHDLAIAKAEYIALDLSNRLGWPAPILADSGNGAHLFYRIDMPNRTAKEFADGMILVETLLKAFNAMFGDDVIKVDEKVFNAARIVRLHGTINRKGANIPERPWRQSRMIRVPDKITPVTIEQMKYLAEVYNDTLASSQAPIVQQTYGDLNIGQWLEDHHIEIFDSKPNRDGGMTFVLENCPWSEEHTDHSAYVMQFKSGAIVAKCHHDGCKGKGWGDLRRLYEPEITIHNTVQPRPAASTEEAGRHQNGTPVGFSAPVDEYELNSVGDLERLHALHPTDLRYCVEQSTWMTWTGVKWAGRIRDSTPAYTAMHDVLDLLVRQAATPNLDPEEKEGLLLYVKKKGCSRMFRDTIDLAESDPRFSVSIMDFDQDNHILNTENGILDLKSFELQNHDPNKLISKSVGYAYDEDAVCPRFIKFLNEIFDNDQELIVYIQRLMGYCLTGSMREKSFYIFWGPVGDNGKSVLTSVLRMLLGEYAATASINTFLYARNEHSARDDLAVLRGARVIIMSEPEENARFAIGLIKNWTGRNPVTCRHLYGSLFTYDPTGKLIVETNIKPRIYERTEAAWDRVHLIPFEVSIPKAQQDKDLEQVLEEELPGILNWALDGLREYVRMNGLHPTIKMRIQTVQYRSENDSAKMFYDDLCTAISHGVMSNQEMYSAYKNYCEGNGIKPLGIRKFIEAFEPMVQKIGGSIHRNNRGLVWYGVIVSENHIPAEACKE